MSHLDTVQSERAKYGTPLGNENAWNVCNGTALVWRATEGWGLLAKPTGNNYNGYSCDVILSVQLKQVVDILGDSEGAGTPQWNLLPWDDSYINRWREPIGDVPPTPPDPPDPPPSDLEKRVDALELDMLRLKQAMTGWIINEPQ